MSDVIIKDLKIELDKFWDWSGMTAEEYSKGRGFGEWEVDYPEWNSLCNCFYEAIKCIQNGNITEELIALMLEAIAVDNEGETLLLECATVLEDGDLEYIVQCAINHIQSEARWQIASLIGKKQKKEWEKYLRHYISDCDKYVQRRALVAYININPDEAVRTALERVKDEDEYMRLASLYVLQELSYNGLEAIIELLAKDSSPIIKEKIEEIKSNIGKSEFNR